MIYSNTEIKTKIETCNKLISLTNVMNKPSNFTYSDVCDLEYVLKDYKYILTELKERKDTHYDAYKKTL